MNGTVAFTGGGTGGHIYPGLAVAEELRSLYAADNHSCRIIWIGSSSGMDRNIVEKSCSADVFYGVPAGKLRRYFSFRNFIDVFKIAAGFIVSFFILLREKPAVVFSKGGFVSVPPCFAAKLLKIPVFTHECDFSPGLATRLNSRTAAKILLSYEATARFFSESVREKIIVTGNPVRPAFYTASAERGRHFLQIGQDAGSKPLLVAVGGSSGARQINELIQQNLDYLCENFTVVHQTGAAWTVSDDTGTYKEDYKAYPFIYQEMPDVLAAADIILSRAGANSLWECAVLGKPMVLIPLEGAGTRGDQVENARFFEEHGAAKVLSGADADGAHLKTVLESLKDLSVRSKCAAAAASLAGTVRPAEKIAGLLYREVTK